MMPVRLLLLVVLLVSNCISVTAAQLGKGILWEISRDGLSPSYLMGTIHSDDERVIHLPPPIRRVFDAADSFTAEIKFEPAQMIRAATYMYSNQGTRLDQLLPPDTYRTTINLLEERGIPEAAAVNLKPWAVAVTLSIPRGMKGMVLDTRLYLDARTKKKKLYGLETVEEQLSIFETLSIEQQITMLEDAIRIYPQMASMFDELMQAYLDRELDELHRLSYRMMQKGDAELNRKLEENMLVKRNILMYQRMQKQLKQGNAFIAVGALHLPGDKGLLQLLKQAGYRVKAVY